LGKKDAYDTRWVTKKGRENPQKVKGECTNKRYCAFSKQIAGAKLRGGHGEQGNGLCKKMKAVRYSRSRRRPQKGKDRSNESRKEKGYWVRREGETGASGEDKCSGKDKT